MMVPMTTTKFRIRQASPTDAPTLGHIELATKLSCYSFLPEEKRAAMHPRQWRQWMLNVAPFHHPQTPRRAFVAYDWNNIWGFAAVRHDSNFAGFGADMTGIFVLPKYQKLGAGRALLVQVARWLAIDEIYTLTVDSYASGPGGDFFEHLGGRPIERWGDDEAWITYGFNNLREIVLHADE